MTKTRVPRDSALRVAQEIMGGTIGVFERIEIAGSIRRDIEQVGDIELVVIPKLIPPERQDVFNAKYTDEMDWAIQSSMGARKYLEKRLNVKGKPIGYGPMNKHLVHVRTGIGLDIFTATEANWGMAMVVRTGPADFSRAVMQQFIKLGHRGHAYGGVTLYADTPDAVEMECPDEATVFRLLEWEYLEPGERR